MTTDNTANEAELLARSIYKVINEGGDLEAVLRRLLSLGPSPELLLDAARWSGAQDPQASQGAWGVVVSELVQAHELGPFIPHPVGDENQP